MDMSKIECHLIQVFPGFHMPENKGKRKLVAILAADAQNYSRLMSEDEEATLRLLKSSFHVIAEVVEKHRGRVVDCSGDSLLAEFASVVDSVQGALEIQRTLTARNGETEKDRRMAFRIGINVGDVIEEVGRLYGDGVNIAARVEQLAEGGEVYISGAAYDQVKSKVLVGYEYQGEVSVKNIPDPIRVYRILSDVTGTSVRKPGRVWATRLRGPLLVAGSGLLSAVLAMILWHMYWRPPPAPKDAVPETSQAVPLPSETSVAVLPFENLSGDRNQEFISDGLTDDIITSISKLPRLFVIARQSTKKYKGKPVTARQISRELGVQYIVEGSVQTSGKRIRVNVQLIDGITGDHVWGERYEREGKEFFQARDEIILDLASSLSGKLTDGDFAKIIRRRVNSLQGWEAVERGYAHYERWTVEDQIQARKWYTKATELEPESVLGWMGIAWTLMKEGALRAGPEGKEKLRQAVEMAGKVRTMDPSYYGPYMLLANIQVREKRFEEALANARKCYELEPNYINSIYILAHVLTYVGKPEAEEAIGLIKKVMRLNPDFRPQYPHSLGRAYQVTGQTDKAVEWYKVAVQKNPKWDTPHVDLAAIYAGEGREEEMQSEAAKVLGLKPNFSVNKYLETASLPKDPTFRERQRAMLLKAGLPE
jgi:adenylate cyclase